MEIIEIDLAVGLKLVYEVEQTKSEGGTRSPPSGGEPPDTKQLNVGDTGSIWITLAVGDVDDMDAGNVEHGERCQGGRYPTRSSIIVAEVEDCAQVLERSVCKVGSSPVLRK